MDQQIRVIDDPDLVHQVDVKLWVGKGSKYGYQDERTARYDACTHRRCETCGALTEKLYVICSACRDKKALERYLSRPKKTLAELEGGDFCFYSEVTETYYSSIDELFDMLESDIDVGDLDEDTTIHDLRIRVCQPRYLREIDLSSELEECDEDFSIPYDHPVSRALDELNRAIREHPVLLYYEPSKFALDTHSIDIEETTNQ